MTDLPADGDVLAIITPRLDLWLAGSLLLLSIPKTIIAISGASSSPGCPVVHGRAQQSLPRHLHYNVAL